MCFFDSGVMWLSVCLHWNEKLAFNKIQGWGHTFLPPPPESVCVRPGPSAAGSQLLLLTPLFDLYSPSYWTGWWRAEKAPGEQEERMEVNINLSLHLERSQAYRILTCPVGFVDFIVESGDSKPIASVLEYSPLSNTYMLSVNWTPSYRTQLTHIDTHITPIMLFFKLAIF